MKFLSKNINTLIFFFISVFFKTFPEDQNLKDNLLEKKIYIKVLLFETSQLENSTINLKCKSGIALTSYKNKFKKNMTSEVTINFLKDSININNENYDDAVLKFDPISGNIAFNDNQFQGSFFIINENNKFLIINKIELEEYIFSVLKTESWPGWPLEVNKAFAIASRSYAIAKYLEATKKKNSYHIKNTNKHQTYKGVHDNEILRQATKETRGIILGYNQKPILAMFDICCGGVIPGHLTKINFNQAPYLKRKERCTFCKDFKFYKWEIDFEKNKLEQILNAEFPNLKKIKKINITKTDKAGIVQQIEIKDIKNKFFLNSKKFNALLKILKSYCYSLIHKGEKIIIKGKGFGHHLGICQWGAREMVNQGWDYSSILKFYYPDTNFMKLNQK